MNLPHDLAWPRVVRRSPALLTVFVLVAAVGCHDHDDLNDPYGTYGTLAGTITSTLGGPLAGIEVTAAPDQESARPVDTTDINGQFSLSSPVVYGTGAFYLRQLPSNCTDPGAVPYSGFTEGATLTTDIEVTCRPRVGTITGVVTGSLGGTVAGVHVSVDPDGDAPAIDVVSDAEGRYTASGVAAGSGSVSVSSGIPSNCSKPAPATYADLATDSTKTVDIVLPCVVTTGALTVSVIGLVDLDGAVRVTGPNGFAATLTATSTLTDLEPGSYTITADTLVVADPVVVSRYLAVVEGSPATLVVGDTTTAKVTYAIRTGSGGLWFTNAGSGSISRFAAGQLHASGSPVDTTSITGPADPAGAAFDTTGNFWVASPSANELLGFTRDQLVAGGTPTPALTIAGASLNSPQAMALDASAKLWIANGNGTLVAYTASQLRAGGTPTPVVSMIDIGLSAPSGMAFDASGNLWVADFTNKKVIELSVSQLATGGSVTPAVTISTSGGSLDSPTAVAFDASGNLWVANGSASAATNTIVSFTPAQLASSGSPTPDVTITMSGTPQPSALAFDESGSLWVAARSSDALLKYSSGQLATSGTPTPATTIDKAAGGTLDAPTALVFDPHAEGLPIR